MKRIIKMSLNFAMCTKGLYKLNRYIKCYNRYSKCNYNISYCVQDTETLAY